MQKTRAAFTSLSLFSWGGCEPHPLHMAPGWGTAPTRPTRSGAALRPGAGWVPRDPTPGTCSLLMPLWSLYPKLCTLLGAGKSEHGTALLPHSMHVAAGLRPPNSSRQWWRIADHTQSPTCPCSAPSLSPPAAHTSAEARGAAPGKSPDKHTTSMGSSAPAWGYTCPSPNTGEMWVMGVP